MGSADVQRASKIAYDMVRKYSIPSPNEYNIEDFDFKIGEKNELSDKSNTIIDKKVEAILKASSERTKRKLEENKHKLEKLATELFKKETLDRKEIKKLI